MHALAMQLHSAAEGLQRPCQKLQSGQAGLHHSVPDALLRGEQHLMEQAMLPYYIACAEHSCLQKKAQRSFLQSFPAVSTLTRL